MRRPRRRTRPAVGRGKAESRRRGRGGVERRPRGNPRWEKARARAAEGPPGGTEPARPGAVGAEGAPSGREGLIRGRGRLPPRRRVCLSPRRGLSGCCRVPTGPVPAVLSPCPLACLLPASFHVIPSPRPLTVTLPCSLTCSVAPSCPLPHHMCPQLAFCLVACYLEKSSELNERVLWGTWPSSRGASGRVQRQPLTFFYECFCLKDNLR